MYGKSPKIRAADEKPAAAAKDEPPVKSAAKADEPAVATADTPAAAEEAAAVEGAAAGGAGADAGIPLADVHVRESKAMHTRHQQEYSSLVRRHAKEGAPAPVAEDGAGEAGDTIDKAA